MSNAVKNDIPQVGSKGFFLYKEFDGEGILEGTVTKVETDHLILSVNGDNYWIDFDDTIEENYACTREEAEEKLQRL